MTTSPADFPDEAALVAQAARSPAAFVRLYRRYYPRIYNYMRYRCDDRATAEDLTAQVFERLLSKIGAYHPERGPFSGWLFAIARNLVTAHRRAIQRRLGISIETLRRWPSNQPGPEEAILQHEAQAELLAAVSHLAERERDLLALKFAALLTNRRIATLTGLSESNVGVILHRAIYRLRDELARREAPRSPESGKEGSYEEN
ncbi:MAG: sigma-70 family RNA polymerase sigma factor [Anaerolineales bacterium]|jgi:RNA polymerase sigma factor (sigma-70 family)